LVISETNGQIDATALRRRILCVSRETAARGAALTRTSVAETSLMLKEMFDMPQQGILRELHEDHQEVSKLIGEIMGTDDNKQRTTLFKQVMTMLIAHSNAEAEVLYKPMKKSDNEESRSFALEGENEHQHVEMQLKEMARAGTKTTETWTAKLTVLKELVEHHVKEEESTGFKCASAEFDQDELEKMGERFQKLKEKEMAA
jgi:predicted outer membrane protein